MEPPAVAPAASTPIVAEPLAMRVLALQRVAGNRATSRILGRMAGNREMGGMLQRTAGNRATRQILHRVCEDQTCPSPGPLTRRPEECTWPQWIASFATLPSFHPRDGVGTDRAAYDEYRRRHHRGRALGAAEPPNSSLSVLGAGPARRGDEHPGGGPANDPAPYAGTTLRQAPFGDEFIDHPTARWLCCNVPPDLVHLAYQLPTDCADVSTILRHVWLAAHGEQERRAINGRTVVLGAGATAAQVEREMISPVDSWSMPQLLDPIVGADSRPARSFAALRTRLRPGDVLVWAHYRGADREGRPRGQTGGHVQTVTSVDGHEISVLEGDMPLWGPQITRLAIERGLTPAQQSQLHNTPGRRIQSATYNPRAQQDDHWGVWTWDGDLLDAGGRYRTRAADTTITRLVIAGRWPPGRSDGRQLARQHVPVSSMVATWIASLEAAATADELERTFAHAMDGARREGASAADVERLVQTAGARLWTLDTADAAARQSTAGSARGARMPSVGLAQWHRLTRMAAAIPAQLQGHDRAVSVLSDASRGIGRPVSSAGPRHFTVVVTGFEPWLEGGELQRNPSGDIALALDGRRETLPDGTTLVIRSMIFPVDSARFDEGVVEQALGPLLPFADAVISLGLNPLARPGSAIRYESVAGDLHVNHQEPIPAAPGGDVVRDPTFLTVDRRFLDRIRGSGATVHTALRVRLASHAEARTFAQAMRREHHGAHVARGRVVEIAGERAVEFVVSGGGWTGTSGTLLVGDRVWSLTLAEGSGGDFFCNELLYRTLRMLLARHARAAARSFFIHLPPYDNESRHERTSGAVLSTIRRVANVSAAR